MLNIIFNVAILCVCCYVIYIAAEFLGDNLSLVATKKKISSAVRGVVFDGVSSSIPELLTSVIAAFAFLGTFNGMPDSTAFADVGIGTIGGSAIFNILIIPLASILVVKGEVLSKIHIDKKGMLTDMFVYLTSVAVLFIGSYFGELNPVIGTIMTFMYVGYVLYLLNKKNHTHGKEKFEQVLESYKSLFCKIGLSLIPIIVSIHFCVNSAQIIGNYFGIPRIIMSLIVLAGVTSVPDLMLSVRSAKKGELDASISNAVGSNSFDILICLGFVIMMSGAKIPIILNEVKYIFVFLIITSICYTTAFYFKSSKSIKVILLTVPYAAFITYLIGLVK